MHPAAPSPLPPWLQQTAQRMARCQLHAHLSLGQGRACARSSLQHRRRSQTAAGQHQGLGMQRSVQVRPMQQATPQTPGTSVHAALSTAQRNSLSAVGQSISATYGPAWPHPAPPRHHHHLLLPARESRCYGHPLMPQSSPRPPLSPYAEHPTHGQVPPCSWPRRCPSPCLMKAVQASGEPHKGRPWRQQSQMARPAVH